MVDAKGTPLSDFGIMKLKEDFKRTKSTDEQSDFSIATLTGKRINPNQDIPACIHLVNHICGKKPYGIHVYVNL